MTQANDILKQKGYTSEWESVRDWLGVPFNLLEYEVQETEFGPSLHLTVEAQDKSIHVLTTWSETLMKECELLEEALPLEAMVYQRGRKYSFLEGGGGAGTGDTSSPEGDEIPF